MDRHSRDDGLLEVMEPEQKHAIRDTCGVRRRQLGAPVVSGGASETGTLGRKSNLHQQREESTSRGAVSKKKVLAEPWNSPK